MPHVLDITVADRSVQGGRRHRNDQRRPSNCQLGLLEALPRESPLPRGEGIISVRRPQEVHRKARCLGLPGRWRGRIPSLPPRGPPP